MHSTAGRAAASAVRRPEFALDGRAGIPTFQRPTAGTVAPPQSWAEADFALQEWPRAQGARRRAGRYISPREAMETASMRETTT